jgi:hypothetical protein
MMVFPLEDVEQTVQFAHDFAVGAFVSLSKLDSLLYISLLSE